MKTKTAKRPTARKTDKTQSRPEATRRHTAETKPEPLPTVTSEGAESWLAESYRHQARDLCETLRPESRRLENAFRAHCRRSGPVPLELSNSAAVYVRDYPQNLRTALIGVKGARGVPEVQRAAGLADHLLKRSCRVLAAAASERGLNPVPFDTGAKAMLDAYAPDPDRDGTVSGLPYPATDWPVCMRPEDWQRLPDTLRSDLIALRDALARLNATPATGGTAGKAEPEPDAIKTAAEPANVFTLDGPAWRIRFCGYDLGNNHKGLVGMEFISKALRTPRRLVPFSKLYKGHPNHPPGVGNECQDATSAGRELKRTLTAKERASFEEQIANLKAEKESADFEKRKELDAKIALYRKALNETRRFEKDNETERLRRKVSKNFDKAVEALADGLAGNEAGQKFIVYLRENVRPNKDGIIYNGSDVWAT
jgi:hypothetical protein